jgi:CDP-diacylglycerol---serine O-phosphatidyltransferase
VSLLLVLAAVVFDFLDGKVAHLTNTGSPYGKDIDSLCDTVSFGVAPAMQMFFYATSFPLALLIGIVWLVAGILRLARFNVLNVKTHFLGTPITLAASVVATAHLLNVPLYLLATMYVIFSILMVSDLKIKKI